MKKRWEAPRILVQQFVANEYVAACYKIKCTTPNGNKTYYNLYADSNNDGQFDANKDKIIYSNWLGFRGCNQWHKGVIQDNPPIANGFVTDYWGNNESAVFWWLEDLQSSSDYHVMTPGNENYETNPNAS